MTPERLAELIGRLADGGELERGAVEALYSALAELHDDDEPTAPAVGWSATGAEREFALRFARALEPHTTW